MAGAAIGLLRLIFHRIALLAFRAAEHLLNLWQAATQVALCRRARHGTVRAEHAAIAREGLEPFATALAGIEELAGIGRHRLDSLIAAFGASECGLKLHIGSCFALSIHGLRQECEGPSRLLISN